MKFHQKHIEQSNSSQVMVVRRWTWYWTYLQVGPCTHERYQSQWAHRSFQWRYLTKTPMTDPLLIPIETPCEWQDEEEVLAYIQRKSHLVKKHLISDGIDVIALDSQYPRAREWSENHPKLHISDKKSTVKKSIINGHVRTSRSSLHNVSRLSEERRPRFFFENSRSCLIANKRTHYSPIMSMKIEFDLIGRAIMGRTMIVIDFSFPSPLPLVMLVSFF